MGNKAAVEAAEAVCASAALLLAVVKRGTDSAAADGPVGFTGPADSAGFAGNADPAGLADSAPLAGCADDDPLRREADGWLDTLALTGTLNAQVAAVMVHAAAGYAGTAQALVSPDLSDRAQEMALIAEVACALTVSERTASTLLTESHALTTSLPLTLSALTAGSLSWQHARVMVDETTNLEPAAAAALEAHFLDPDAPTPARGPAGELVPSRFRHKARIWRERHHPVSIEKRHTRAVADRRLEYRPDRDGMAWLSAYLPADQAAGIWNRTTAAARALQGPDEHRTMTQMRADIAATLLLGGTDVTDGDADNLSDGVSPSPRAQVLITMPVMSLLGATDEPAMLDGYGPIPATMARRLIAAGATSFHRVLIDPRDGAPLEIGRTSYPVTKAQRQWLRMRDGKCPFPGCSNHSLDNEADHLLAWAHGGTTGIANLAQPCPKHHRLRHTTAWKPGPATTNEPPGWISPTGRRYASEHPDWEPPELPEGLYTSSEIPERPLPSRAEMEVAADAGTKVQQKTTVSEVAEVQGKPVTVECETGQR
ncbi:HNH endonuclease signature motif containing protein [Arthrobacter sp. HMWF013]|uniref:HNH endonuclease signature motif containing protein n=1 Tax=Arthrobacter sp. HMWF013 TaxID=2056849 RepID=UPI000D3C1CEC|nr:HNH endonuclease signature motif containing protein [Arthrobacter sp. HMWF013]PTT62187.1 endonuclease [Arthrobacter sp. HMWF013]